MNSLRYALVALAMAMAVPARAQIAWEALPFMSPAGHVANVASYLVQFICQDGSPRAPQSCDASYPQTGAALVNWRRADWGSNGAPYYQVSDSFLRDDAGAIVQTYEYSPWGPFVQSDGDGGQVGFTDGTKLRWLMTQDGGTPYLQYFVGSKCGGTGWLSFDFGKGLQQDSWTGEVARLAIARSPNDCPSLGQAWTQWLVGNVTYPFKVFGASEDRQIWTIVSEHYDHGDIGSSVYMEREFLGQGFGRLRWEAWESPQGSIQPVSDLDQRCPQVGKSFSDPNGWRLYDCRHLTNIISSPGWHADKYNWPQ